MKIYIGALQVLYTLADQMMLLYVISTEMSAILDLDSCRLSCQHNPFFPDYV